MKFANRAARAGFAAIIAVAAFATAAAADYPEKPVRVIVPNKAGGGADIIVRLVSDELSKVLGQPVVVQNQPGAATAVGSRAANEADPDGYTVLANHEAIITLATMGRLGFDIEGLDPVAKTGGFANFLVAGAAAPFSTYPDFCAHAAENPGAISAAVQIGALSHFHVISAADACGAELNYVNVTGGGAAFRAALLGGTIDVAPMPALTAKGLGESGDINVLAFLGSVRHPALPDVQTTSEHGFGAAEGDFNFYWWVRDEVPEAIKDQLSASLGEAFAALVESGRLEELSMSNPEFLDRAAVTERIDDKMSSIGAMVKAAGLAAQ